jgi:hypothetical protein
MSLQINDYKSTLVILASEERLPWAAHQLALAWFTDNIPISRFRGLVDQMPEYRKV